MANIFSRMLGYDTKPKVAPFKEAGVTGAQVFSGYVVDREKNPKLSYLQRNTEYENLIANLAVIGAGVRYFTALGTSANWSIEANPNDTTEQYKEIAEKLIDNLDVAWSSVIGQAMNFRWFGFSVQEWTARRDPIDGTIYFRTIEQRPQRTIEQFDMDDTGNVLGFGQRAPLSGTVLYVPRAKTLYIVDDNFSDSPAGLGILRHVFESCERLANYMDLELQGFQKDLRNMPIGHVPYTELNKAVANGEITEEQATTAIAAMENLVKMARKQSATGLMLDSKPYTSQSDTAINVSPQKQWDLTLLTGESPGLPEIAAAIERVQLEIARVLGTDGMMLTGSGSNAMAKEKQAALYLNINSTLQVIKHSLNKDIMDPFWKLNGFPEEMKPKFAVEDVNGKDAESIAAVLRDLSTAGAPMAPDDEAINAIRDILGLPQVDLEAAALQAVEDRQMEIDAQSTSMAALQAKGKQNLGPN